MFPRMPKLFFFNFLTIKFYVMKSLQLMIALVCFIAISQTAAQAQNAQILNVNLNLSGAASDAAYNEVTGVGVDTFEVWVEVLLSDTAISNLQVEMKSAVGRVVYLNPSFSIANNGSATAGTSYSRNGQLVSLNLGRYFGTKEYVLQVREERNGVAGAWVEY
jgi:hypothetical protein